MVEKQVKEFEEKSYKVIVPTDIEEEVTIIVNVPYEEEEEYDMKVPQTTQETYNETVVSTCTHDAATLIMRSDACLLATHLATFKNVWWLSFRNVTNL